MDILDAIQAIQNKPQEEKEDELPGIRVDGDNFCITIFEPGKETVVKNNVSKEKLYTILNYLEKTHGH